MATPSMPACTVDELRARAQRAFPPTIVDVRRRAAFERDPVRIPMSLRCEPEAVAAWASALEPWRPVVAYCVHGHEVSQDAADALRARGLSAAHLEGGLEQWRASGAPVEPWAPPTRWVTRARPKIDRLACPWLVRRFVDASAEVFYVDADRVTAYAAENSAVPFDVPDVAYTHEGERCSFDAFVARHAPHDEALHALATIVRAADTDTLERSPAAAGLLAVSLGLGHGIADDGVLMKHGLLVYDALYAWCRGNPGERHGWDPAALRS
jgi:rhodanese-related sulfurtransferase